MIKSLEVRVEEKLPAVGIENILSSLTLRENIDVFDYIKIKNLCSSEDITHRG